MTEKNNTVPFDPGYSKHVTSFVYFNEQVELAVKSLKTPQQRSFRFRQLLPQILSVLKNEIGFYRGCLLWAAYLKYNFSENPKEIAGNSFYGKSIQELVDFDYLKEVNYILDYIEQYPKTLNYYKINGEKIDEKYKITVQTYKEFLRINKSFINTKITTEIELPENIKIFDKDELNEMKLLIDAAVNNGDFDILFKNKIYKNS